MADQLLYPAIDSKVIPLAMMAFISAFKVMEEIENRSRLIMHWIRTLNLCKTCSYWSMRISKSSCCFGAHGCVLAVFE